MKIDMTDYTVVTSYFANAGKLEADGFKLMSVSIHQPKGVSLPVLEGSVPSEFCLRLSSFGEYNQAGTEYKRQKSSSGTLGHLQTGIRKCGSPKIAIVGWYKDDSKCFRKHLREVLNKHFNFAFKVEEFKED